MPSCMEDIDIPVPWGHISAKWWGPKDKQPIVCLHGWQDNAASFDNLAAKLPEDVSLFCFDMMGHGRSSHIPPGHLYFSFWDTVVMIRRIVKHFGWKNITLMGHSRGGAIAFIYAAVFNDDVDKLICLDIAYCKTETFEKVINNSKDAIDRFLKVEITDDSIAPCYGFKEMIDIVEDAYKGSLTTESAKIMMNRGMMPSKAKPGMFTFSRDARLKFSSTLGLIPRYMSLYFAENIKCEYLNIRCMDGDYVGDYFYDKILDIIKENAKHFEYHDVDGTHHVHLNEPENIDEIITSFLHRSAVSET